MNVTFHTEILTPCTCCPAVEVQIANLHLKVSEMMVAPNLPEHSACLASLEWDFVPRTLEEWRTIVRNVHASEEAIPFQSAEWRAWSPPERLSVSAAKASENRRIEEVAEFLHLLINENQDLIVW